MRLIDGEALYERLVELENLARDRVIDTPNSFSDGSLNPAAVRYMAQLSERIQLKEMVFDAPTIKPEPHWIPNTKETVPKDPLRKQIQLKNGWIITGWFDGEDWFPVPEVGASLLFDNVLAWCELPSPYQSEGEESK